MLRREIHRLGLPRNFNIIDDEDAKMLAKKAMSILGLDRSETTVKKFLDSISGAKSRMREGYVPMFTSPAPWLL